MPVQIDHCALLVENLEETLETFASGCRISQINAFPAEGTREVYVRHPDSDTASILLMQAIGDGPYMRALGKRGPGLHHICIRVSSIADFIEETAGGGFLLHPCSLKSYEHGVVYLCRPGIPFLVEVETLSEQNQNLKPDSRLVSEIGLPLDAGNLAIVKSVFAEFIKFSELTSIKINTAPAAEISFHAGKIVKKPGKSAEMQL